MKVSRFVNLKLKVHSVKIKFRERRNKAGYLTLISTTGESLNDTIQMVRSLYELMDRTRTAHSSVILRGNEE